MTVEDLFQELIGKTVWSLRQTHGSCFLMEVGRPYLQIREPILPRKGISPERAFDRRRRRVFFRGDWSLVVLDCNWSVRAWEYSANQNSIQSDMGPAFDATSGQCLTCIQYDGPTKSLTLDFDLGAQMRIWPRSDGDPVEEQWTLYAMNDKRVVSLLNNGEISVDAGDDI
jgi:hypothetical protein